MLLGELSYYVTTFLEDCLQYEAVSFIQIHIALKLFLRWTHSFFLHQFIIFFLGKLAGIYYLFLPTTHPQMRVLNLRKTMREVSIKLFQNQAVALDLLHSE